MAHAKNHDYHILNPSVWPLIAAGSAFAMLFGAVAWMTGGVSILFEAVTISGPWLFLMGFAGVLTEIGLPQSDYLTALISFNVGVEFGQLAVIALCFLLVGWFRNKPWYRSVIVIPASAAISLVGLYWTWERIAG